MTTSSMPVTLRESSATRITWTATPTAPLFLNQLSITKTSGDVNAVTGHITPGTVLHPAPCTLHAGATKFATLLADCGATGLSEAITYDGGFNASDVTGTVSLAKKTG